MGMLPPPHGHNKPVLRTLRRRLGEVNGVLLEILKIDELKRGLMRRAKDNPRRLARFEGFEPPGRAEAPTITRLQAWKAKARDGCRKIVPA